MSSENFVSHFHLILHVMSDKAAFVSERSFVYSVTGETFVSRSKRLLLADNEFAYTNTNRLQVCGKHWPRNLF